jgi:two-component system, cell cycle response regulator CpdR
MPVELGTAEAPPDADAEVLCVEPDPFLGELVRTTLSSTGCRVTLVPSAELALARLRATPFVAVVVNGELGQGRGLDLVGRIRTEHAGVFTVLMTADKSVIGVVEGLRVERVFCLAQPFGREELRRLVALAVSCSAEARAALGGEAGPEEPRPKSLPPRSVPPESGASLDVSRGVSPGELPPGLRVLVVDDDPLVRRSMARAFRGHKVTLAENGRAATKEIERERPDLIVSDLRMPEMDGLELASEVSRRWPELADRILFFSGTDSHIERARHEAPLQPLVKKSASGEELSRRMAEVLELAARRPRA